MSDEPEIELEDAPEDTGPPTWGKITVYKDKSHREVIELQDLITEESVFKGGIIIAVQGPRGVQPYRHEFLFTTGWTMQQCFDNFDEEAQKAAEQWQQYQRKAAEDARKQIVAPRQAGPAILGPGGKPANRQERRRNRR